jgi:hypothetical protein
VTENLITKNLLGTAPLALQIVGNCRGESRDCIGVHRLVVEGNVISDWGGPIRIEGDARQLEQITLARNDIRESVGRGVLIEHVDPASMASVHWSGNRLGSLHAPADAWVRVGRSTCSVASWQRQVDDLSPDADFLTPSDPERDLATYVRTLDATDGGADGEAAFFAGIRAQSKATWRPEYTAAAVNRYLRAGHGLVTR